MQGDKRIAYVEEVGNKTLTVKMSKGFKLWSPESPNLYTSRSNRSSTMRCATDVEIEINGLLTYDRKVLKFNPSVLREAHGKLIDAVSTTK